MHHVTLTQPSYYGGDTVISPLERINSSNNTNNTNNTNTVLWRVKTAGLLAPRNTLTFTVLLLHFTIFYLFVC